MGRLKQVVVTKQGVKTLQQEKQDNIFRIFTIINQMKNKVVTRIELPDNNVYEQHYGNMPQFEVVIPFIGETLELYHENELVGMRKLVEATKYKMKLEEIK